MNWARVFPFKWFEICYMKEAEWAEYWRRLHPAGTRTRWSRVTTGAKSREGDFEAMMDREIARAKIAVQLDNVFLDAIRSNASEVHFTPRGPRRRMCSSAWTVIFRSGTPSKRCAAKQCQLR